MSGILVSPKGQVLWRRVSEYIGLSPSNKYLAVLDGFALPLPYPRSVRVINLATGKVIMGTVNRTDIRRYDDERPVIWEKDYLIVNYDGAGGKPEQLRWQLP